MTKDNKMKLIKELFGKFGDGSPNDMLNLLEAFENLLDDGYIESFTNDLGETDYRITNRYDAMALLKEMK